MNNHVTVSRISIDLIQKQLAKRVGVTRQTISLIEQGKYNPSLKLCLKISYTVYQTLDELFLVEEDDFYV